MKACDHFLHVSRTYPSDANLQTTARPHMAGGSCDEDHYAAPRSRLTYTYLGGYVSINSQQVIDPTCRTLTMCSSERSLILLGGLSSNGCAAKESRRSGL